MSSPKGFIIYKGPSMLDGKPIIAIATLSSSNKKTGDMIQTWILPDNHAPTEMYHDAKLQASVCGICPLQHSRKGGCYVNLGQAPRGIYVAYKKGSYDVLEPKHLKYFADRKLRMGSFGDPAAVPYETWLGLKSVCNGHTGYTHQAAHIAFDRRIASLCMISVETPKQAAKYHAKGWSTFRVRTIGSGLLDNEIECLADATDEQCIRCGICAGKGKPNVVVTVHGSGKTSFTKQYAKTQIIAIG